MTSAISLILTTVLSLSTIGPRPVLIVRGSDSARGVLINRTPGFRPFDPPDRSRPTVVFIHGFNPAPLLVHFEMGLRFSESLARRGMVCNSMEWDWNAATCDSLIPRINSFNSVEQGRMLACQLNCVGIDPARVHLIGHSAGARVATSAASVVASEYGRPVAQLTLLDPATYYHSVIFKQLKAGSLAPLVENYWTSSPSGFGKEVHLSGVRDYQVNGRSYYIGVFLPIRSDHLFVVSWYLASIEDASTATGFNTNQWIGKP